MSYTTQETTKAYLEAASLPNHGKSYTVISHKEVMDNTINMLNASGFKIVNELYKATLNANVAQGIYQLAPINSSDEDVKKENELGMMFAWTNSYDKSTRFQCAIGGYVMVCNNGMVAGDMMSFARKHTGTASYDVKMQIANQIKNAEKYYKKVIADKNSLKTVNLSLQEQSQLLGRLYAEKGILTINQVSVVKAEMDEASYDYNCDQGNAWSFYNHVTHAMKKTHPKKWLKQTQAFHEFIMADLQGKMGLKTKDHVVNLNSPDFDLGDVILGTTEDTFKNVEVLDMEETIESL